MGSRSKYRAGGWWPYGRASAEERAANREAWLRPPKWIRKAGSRVAKRINRARRAREPKSLGDDHDDG